MKMCIEKGCPNQVNPEFSRIWCEAHEIERRKRITAQLEKAMAYLENKKKVAKRRLTHDP